MDFRSLGFVTHVTRYIDGKIENEFFDFEKNQIVTCHWKSSEWENGFPEAIVPRLADSSARDIWTKIEDENDRVTSLSFEAYYFEKDLYRLREKLDKVSNAIWNVRAAEELTI